MFDKLLDKSLSNLVPKQLDLGNFDKTVSWIRDCTFSAFEMNLGMNKIKNLISSLLSFIYDFDDLNDIHFKAIAYYCNVIYYELTDEYIDFYNLEVE